MRFGRFDQSVVNATVTASLDLTYLPNWLTDGSPGTPVRKTGTSLSATISPGGSVSCDLFAVLNHNIRQAASISVSGSVSTTIETAAWPPNRIPHNWFRLLETPVSVSSLGLSVSGNTGSVIIGEFYAGLSTEFPGLLAGRKFSSGSLFQWEGEFSSLAPYDPGIASQRRVSGSLILDDDEYAALEDVHASQRNGASPVVWVENEDVNDVWLVQFDYTSEHRELLWFVNLEIAELPRSMW